MNFTLIIIAAVVQFVLGALWYSPLLFGKVWMSIMEVSHYSKEELQKMQKSMMPFYGLQFLLTLWTTFHLSRLSAVIPGLSIYNLALWLWLGFIVPIQIACVVWSSTKRKYWVKQISIMVSYQLVGILLAAFVLSM